ncbi:hypothetical protein [Pseudoalteromonas sp. SaAl2]
MKKILILLCFLSATAFAQDDYSVSLYAGKNFSQTLETKEALKVEVNDGNHFAFSIDRNIDRARYGFYFAQSNNEPENTEDKEVTMKYFLFQSAVEVALSNHINSYVGAQVGANYVQTNFTSNDVFFASGLYGGIEYLFSDTARVLFETRWLATIVNNESTVNCTLPTDEDDQCLWHFDGDVLNQFQTSLGFTYRF